MTVPPSDELRTYLSERFPTATDLTLRLRALLLDIEPDLTERLQRGWGGLGFHYPDAGYVVGLFPRGDAVRMLFEHGASLPDPHGVLRGDGVQTRYLPCGDVPAREVVEELVHAAVIERVMRR